jgi:hypothetical protein
MEERLKKNQAVNFQQMMAEARKRARAKSNSWPSLPKTGWTRPVSDDALALPLPDSIPDSDDGRNSPPSSVINRAINEVKKWQRGRDGTYRHLIEAHWDKDGNWQPDRWEVLVPQNTPESIRCRSVSVENGNLPPPPPPPRHVNTGRGQPSSPSNSDDSSDTDRARRRFEKNRRLRRDRKISQRIARARESTPAPHHLFFVWLDGELLVAPGQGEDMRWALDVGTRTGIWAIEFSK